LRRNGARDLERLVLLLAADPRPEVLERHGEVGRALEALRRVLRERPRDDVLELLGDQRSLRAQRRRNLVRDPVEHRLHVAGEGRLPRDALVEHRPEGVDVGARIDLVAGELLGAEVVGCSDEGSRLRNAPGLRGASEPEVHHPDAQLPVLLVDHHVLGLHVAMHDAARVRVLESFRDADADLEEVAQALQLLAEERAEALAPHDRHHEKERALRRADVVDRHDSGMIHLRDELRLAPEPLLGLGGKKGRRNDLDRDVAVQQRVVRTVDNPHPAVPQLADDLVPITKFRADHSRRLLRAL